MISLCNERAVVSVGSHGLKENLCQSHYIKAREKHRFSAGEINPVDKFVNNGKCSARKDAD